MKWHCNICGKERQDKNIHIYVSQTGSIKYCGDSISCKQKALNSDKRQLK